MKLPWRYERDPNPWDEEVGLSGWFPGQAGPSLDLLALVASIARAQWELNEDYMRVLTAMKWQSRVSAIAWLIVMAGSLASLAAQKGWW